MPVDVVGTVLAVVLDHEDHRVLPVPAVRDLIDDVANGEVAVGDLRLRVRRTAGVVTGEPHHVEVGGTSLLELLLPDLVAVDVRDRGVERRRQRIGDVVQRRDHRAVVALQVGGGQLGGVTAVLDALDRAVVLLPRTGRLALGVLELTVVACGIAGVLDRRPQEARTLVAQHVLLGVVAALVLTRGRLGVLGVIALHQPVVALGRVRADVVQVVVETELLGQRVLVRRDLRSELRQARVAVALGHVAVHLVVGAVLLDQHEDVLDRRRVTDARRDRHGPGPAAPGILRVVPAPAVLGKDRIGVPGDVPVARKGEAGEGGGGAVRAVTHRDNGALTLVERERRAARVDAAGVGDDDLVADGRHGRRVVVRRQQADVVHRLPRVAVILVDGDGVRTAEGDQQVAVVRHGDARGLVPDVRRRPRLGLDRLHDRVPGRVDDRDSVTVRIGDEQRVVLDVHGGRVQADCDRPDGRRRIRGVDDADRSGRRRAEVPIGRHLGAVGAHGRVAGLGLSATLVAHIELVANEGELTRGDTDIPRPLDCAAVGVERHDGVLSVDRGVQRGPVG